jgi:putative ABC transport system permease protein
MSWLRRLANVFRRERLDSDIEAELQFHLEMRAADLRREGRAPAEARREASRLLGNASALRDRTRDADVWVWLETAWQDARYAVRLLAKSPVFTAAAVLTLAIGIGANAAMFGVLHAVLIKPLPYPESDRLFVLFRTSARAGGRTRVAPLDFVDWRQRSRAFTLAAHVGTGFTLTGTGDPELVVGQMVAGDLFDVLGVRPALGAGFGDSARPGAGDDAMVLSHGLWQRRFGGDPSVLGRTISANGRPYTIAGVMPPRFSYQGPRYQLWVPFPLRAPNPNNLPITRDSRYLQVIGRLNPGVTPAAATEEMNALAKSLAGEYPDSNADSTIGMASLTNEAVGDVRAALELLFAAVLLVLLIACGNVTSLLLARFTVRGPEVVVRTALGASRMRVIRQFVVETVVLYAVGTAAGLLLGVWLLNLLRGLAPGVIPRADEIQMALPVALFACGTSLVAALVFGLVPAWQATRESASTDALRSRATTSSRPHQRFRSTIVVAQLAVALCLLSGASLVARSLLNLHRVEKGFDAEGRVVFTVVMPPARFPNADSMRAFYRRILAGLHEQPGFARVGLTTHLPLSGQDLENGLTIDGYTPPTPAEQPIAALRGISPDYMTAMGIRLRAGRAFTEADDERAAPTGIVNEAFVRRYLGGADALGRRVSLGGADGPWRTIVGVVADVRHRALDADARPELLLPYTQLDPGFLTAWARGLTVVVRGEGDVTASADLVRATMRRVDANSPVIELRPMTALVAAAVSAPRFRTFVLSVFALIAVVLAAVGVFGVLSYLVSQRTREIGIRMALGAHPRAIFREVLGQGARLVLIGTVLGVAAGALLSRWIGGLLFQVSPVDPLTIGAAACCLALVALVAALVPARRATAVNPIAALRN